MMKKFKKIIFIFVLTLTLVVFVGCRMERAEDVVKVKEETIPTEVTGEDLDLSKIMLEVKFVDGTDGLVRLNEKMLVSTTLSELKKPGKHTVRVTYKDAFVSFDLEVLEKYPDVKVKFMVGDKVFEERTVEKHKGIGELPKVTKLEGYQFAGWYLETYRETEATKDTKAEYDGMKIYAHLIPIAYDVKFVCGEDEVTEKVAYGDAIYYFPTFFRNANEIEGYYIDGKKITPDTKITKSVTVTVKLK